MTRRLLAAGALRPSTDGEARVKTRTEMRSLRLKARSNRPRVMPDCEAIPVVGTECIRLVGDSLVDFLEENEKFFGQRPVEFSEVPMPVGCDFTLADLVMFNLALENRTALGFRGWEARPYSTGGQTGVALYPLHRPKWKAPEVQAQPAPQAN